MYSGNIAGLQALLLMGIVLGIFILHLQLH